MKYLLLILFLAGPVKAAVTFDAATSEQASAAASVTFSHTVAADANALIVCGSNIFGSFFSLVSATYNGDALVQVSSETIGSDTFYMWRLLSPDTGTHDVVLTWDGTGGAVYGYSASFKGVDSIAGTFNTNGSGSSLSNSVASAADGMAMDCGYVTASGTPGTEGAGQTEITNDGILPSVSSYKSSSGASTSFSWTLDGSVTWGYMGIGLAPAGAPAAAVGYRRAVGF